MGSTNYEFYNSLVSEKKSVAIKKGFISSYARRYKAFLK